MTLFGPTCHQHGHLPSSTFARLAIGVLVLASPASGQVPLQHVVLDSPEPGFVGEFGESLIAADIDADGFDDLVCGEPGADLPGVINPGRLWIFFGPGFARMRQVLASMPVQDERLGEAITPAVDA